MLAVKNKQMKGCERQKSISKAACFTSAEGSLGGYSPPSPLHCGPRARTDGTMDRPLPTAPCSHHGGLRDTHFAPLFLQSLKGS